MKASATKNPKTVPGAKQPDPLCTKCLAEPRRKGQRWGKRCHASYMVGQRAKDKEKRT